MQLNDQHNTTKLIAKIFFSRTCWEIA